MSNDNIDFLDNFKNSENQEPKPESKLTTKTLTFKVKVKVEYIDESDYDELHTINKCEDSIMRWKITGTGKHLTPTSFKFIKSENT